MKKIDIFLNSITMYRLVLNFLWVMIGVSCILTAFHFLPFSLLSLFYSFMILTVVSYGTNLLYATLLKVQSNVESSSITALILFLIVTPPTTWVSAAIVAVAAFIAIASKYVLNIKGRHLFNPAAISLVVIALSGFGQGSWWIGSGILLPFSLIGGLLIVRKIKRFPLLLSFGAVAVVEIVTRSIMQGTPFFPSLWTVFASWPLVFFGTILLTEPATMPSTRNKQIIYGLIVGFLFGSVWNIGPLYATPEVALGIGNLFAFFSSYRPKLRLYLKEKREIAVNIKEFVFANSHSHGKSFAFTPGQYMEWTYAHPKNDARGVRRYFTISSSPTEKDIKIGIRLQPEKASTFKSALSDMQIGDEILASSLSGDFTLPKNKDQKLAFIAGGIGITPFRSMIKYLIDLDEKRDIVLFYTANKENEFAYEDIFKEGQKVGVKTFYSTSRWDDELKKVPFGIERHWYISGPNAMVEKYSKVLTSLNVPDMNIKKDYFPGF